MYANNPGPTRKQGLQLPCSRVGLGLSFYCICLFLFGCGGSSEPTNKVVVYCAHDREFAEEILDDFTRQTGIKVLVRYDTEANKAVGLYEDLVRESARPRCDVHWNNEILATIRLQEQGILQPYPSPAGEPFPEAFKAADRSWHAFAARARILLINTKLVARGKRPAHLRELTGPAWKGRVAMAKPQFGTTASEAACIFQAWGPEKAEAFYKDLHANGVHLVAGNKQVAVGVGKGQFAAGLTDTDDAMAEVEAGNPVALIYPDAASNKKSPYGTLFLPNTVAVIHGCPNPEAAKKLVDFLLSPEVEAKLAEGPSKQIPLNPQVKATLAIDIKTPAMVRSMPVDYAKAAKLWPRVQSFLIKEFARN
jgi:iron(III) transport system substrate-binding protein